MRFLRVSLHALCNVSQNRIFFVDAVVIRIIGQNDLFPFMDFPAIAFLFKIPSNRRPAFSCQIGLPVSLRRALQSFQLGRIHLPADSVFGNIHNLFFLLSRTAGIKISMKRFLKYSIQRHIRFCLQNIPFAVSLPRAVFLCIPAGKCIAVTHCCRRYGKLCRNGGNLFMHIGIIISN